MTIKEIKEKYKYYQCEGGEHNKFAVYDWKDGNGKIVVVVKYVPSLGWKDVIQAVRVRDGKHLMSEDRCRPCDNLDDAIDVAAEMIYDGN